MGLRIETRDKKAPQRAVLNSEFLVPSFVSIRLIIDSFR
jgi:hypothetical protein